MIEKVYAQELLEGAMVYELWDYQAESQKLQSRWLIANWDRGA